MIRFLLIGVNDASGEIVVGLNQFEWNEGQETEEGNLLLSAEEIDEEGTIHGLEIDDNIATEIVDDLLVVTSAVLDLMDRV